MKSLLLSLVLLGAVATGCAAKGDACGCGDKAQRQTCSCGKGDKAKCTCKK